MVPNRSANSFHGIDSEQLRCHARANDTTPLNRSTVEPLDLKSTNRDTTVDKAGLLLRALQPEQSRCRSRTDEPLLLSRRAIHQLLGRSFRGGMQRTPFVTDSAESES